MDIRSIVHEYITSYNGMDGYKGSEAQFINECLDSERVCLLLVLWYGTDDELLRIDASQDICRELGI